MGLDQYCWTVRSEDAVDDFKIAEDAEKSELHYWRKYSSMQAWMESLYREKGGPAEVFNCVYVRLTKADMLRLIEDAKAGQMKSVDGYFFGRHYDYDRDCANADIGFAHRVMAEIDVGRAVYYSSWW